MDETQIIKVAALVIQDAHNRVLTVRKRGTQRFMQPGGKPEAGETPMQTALREAEEEIGVQFQAEELTALGQFSAAAANEPGHRVVCETFQLTMGAGRDGLLDQVRPAAEIAELRWWPLEELYSRAELAPLLTEEIAPRLRVQAASSVSG